MIAVAAPGLLGHLPSISNLGIDNNNQGSPEALATGEIGRLLDIGAPATQGKKYPHFLGLARQGKQLTPAT